MSDSILHYFYSTLPVICNNITSNIRLAMLAENNYTIEGALLDLISPDQWHSSCSIVIANHLDTIFVRLLDLIIKQFWFVILNFDAHSANLNLILYNIGINIKRCDNSWTSAKSYFISLYLGHWCLALNVYTSRLAGHDNVLRDYNIILRLLVQHNGSWIKMSERAFMDCCITLKWQYASSIGVLKRITFEVGMEDLDACIGHWDDAGDFAVGLSGASI